jgi:uncharacterized surface protein with fasciclin (FAS1) repeats
MGARTRKRASALLLLPAVTLAFGACDDDPVAQDRDDIVDVAASTAALSTLVTALQTAELDATLAGPGPFTVFAPTNAAFGTLSAGSLDLLLEADNRAILVDLLGYHVVAGEIEAADLTDGQTLTTVEGGTLEVSVAGGEVRVNGVLVSTADVGASNGVVHLIDGVLTQTLDVVQRASIEPALSTLVTAVVAADLAGALSGPGPFTVFAPIDDAFAALPAGALDDLLDDQAALTDVLTYHVVGAEVFAGDLVDDSSVGTLQGSNVTIDLTGGAFVNGATIIATDIVVSNGVVHLIDEVLLPPSP